MQYGRVVQGRRLPDGTKPRHPGEYAWMPYALWEVRPSFFLGDGEWHLMDPTGGMGAAGRVEPGKPAAHTWTVHEDDSVTFSPSLVMPSGWHGFLQRGVWTP